MLPRFISLLLIPLVGGAQEPIPFMISATPCSFCLVTNEYVQWMVSIEPEGNCLYHWSDCVEIPEFEPVPGGDGTTFLNYSTAERGKHHLLLVEKETGRSWLMPFFTLIITCSLTTAVSLWMSSIRGS